MSVYHPSMWVPQDVYRSHGGYRPDYEYAMDSELVHRLIAAGVSFHTAGVAIAAMRLGGKSHQNIWQALSEFRRSVRMHRLQGPVVAEWYRLRQLLFHVIVRFQSLRQIYLRLRSRRA